MRKKIYGKVPSALLTFLTFSIAFYQLLKIYNMEGRLNSNIVVIALFCLIAGLFSRGILRFPLYILGLYIGLYLNFSQHLPFSLAWGASFWQRIMNLSELFLAGRIGYLPEEIAVSLVFIVMVLLVELVVIYKRVVISYLIVIGYMLFLIVYNDMELHIEIVLFASIGLLQRFLVLHKKTMLGFLTIIAFLGILMFTTFFIPSDFVEMKMLEPSATLRNYLNERGFYQFIETTGVGNLTRSGFSENDEVLGGPLLDDNQILFEAQQQSPHYWRVDSKSYYSGSGWQNPSAEETVLHSYSGEQIELPNAEYQGRLAEEEEITISRETNDTYLPLPYGNKQIKIEEGTTELYTNQETQRADFQNAQQSRLFQIDWQDLEYTMEDLNDISVASPDSTIDYLQLPDQLPERVRSLAEELTVEEETLVGKVTAVEDYLKNSGNFRYSKIDTEFPTENQDYVDHFLFDSQVGYCDNFSSAMVVMLRAVGIPARWSKGFSTGEKISENHYVVRNSDAHSWAEVYFEGYGWLPFEATPSFSQPLQQTAMSSETTETSSAESSTSQETSESTTEESSSSTQSTSTAESSAVIQTTNEDSLQLPTIVKNIIYVVMTIIIFGIVYILWQKHFYLYVFFLSKITGTNILKIYPSLLKKAEKFVSRTPEQPLNYYAKIFETKYPQFNGSFIKLTDSYEKYLYGGIEETGEQQRNLIFEVARQFTKMKKQ